MVQNEYFLKEKTKYKEAKIYLAIKSYHTDGGLYVLSMFLNLFFSYRDIYNY